MTSVLFMVGVLLGAFGSTHCSIQIVFPSETKLVWKPVLKGTRYCPQSAELNLEPDLKTMAFDSKVPIGITPSNSDGYLCHAAKWVTTCDFRWYGPKYITHSVHSLRPTVSDCKAAVEAYNAGTLMYPGFPPESCGYASITDSEFYVMLVTPHPVGVDDYRGHWVDPLFPTSECNSNFCETVHNATMWIPKDLKTHDVCSQDFQTIRVSVMYPQTKPTKGADLTLKSKFHAHMKGDRVCKMKFCNKNGLRLGNGEWIEVGDEVMLDNSKLLSLFPDCLVGSVVKSTLLSEGVQTALWETDRLLDYSLCQNTWEKIDRKEPLSAVDLSYLAPRSPGKGMAYIVANGSLMSAPARYIRVWIDSPILKEIKGKKESASGIDTVLWEQWLPFNGMELGPNGLIKTKSGYKFPLYLLGMGIVDQDLQELSSVNPVDHPHVPIAQAFVSEGEEVFFGDTGVSKNPIELISGWFSDWKETAAALGFAAISVILIIGLMRLLPLLCRRRKQKKVIYKDVELNSFDPRQAFHR
ncbi:glycoprotein [Isfahan virus]|uniref:Glycoprotein n=1 Tax=Isfahan virus TaxID=290008 RepID=GLYCO_ISFV|nr:glycoprotein [Isfahan virus]Q5K2K4.1 RecName: Full=Glycoprotein; Flags: Precursor [Isfahan virus]CAH17547.1 glycoprotein [Isfahan virus]